MSVIQKRVQSALQPAWASDIVLGGQEGGEGLGSLRGRRGSSGLGLSAVCLDLAGSLRHVCLWLCCGPRGPHGVKPGGSGYRWRHVFLRYINKHRKKKKTNSCRSYNPHLATDLNMRDCIWMAIYIHICMYKLRMPIERCEQRDTCFCVVRKAYVLCFWHEPTPEAVWGSAGKRGLQDCLLSSTWDSDAGTWSQEMGEKWGKLMWPQGLTQTEQKLLFGKWLCLRKSTSFVPPSQHSWCKRLSDGWTCFE